MKFIFFIFLIFMHFSINAQSGNSIICREIKPKANAENHYHYFPPEGLSMPNKPEVVIIYESNGVVYQKFVQLTNGYKGYDFTFKAPDSTAVLIISIVDKESNLAEYNFFQLPPKVIIDNNSGAGYIIILYNRNGNRFKYEKISLGQLMLDYNSTMMQLKPVPNKEIIKWFEDAYNACAALKNENSYLDYLFLLNELNPLSGKPKLIKYAKQLLSQNANESKWLQAKDIYKQLKMEDSGIKMDEKIIQYFPDGHLAAEQFLKNMWQDKTKEYENEEKVLGNMAQYISRFQDSSNSSKHFFFSKITSNYISKNNLDELIRFGNQYNIQSSIASDLNYYAWKNAGKTIDNAGENLELSKKMAQLSLSTFASIKENIYSSNGDEVDKRGTYNLYANTYAIVLYKLGMYDSAFIYQDEIYRQGRRFLNNAAMERYTLYAEKAKGLPYAKKILENELFSRTCTPFMVNQLIRINNTLGLPENDTATFINAAREIFKQQNEKIVKALYGTVAANNFSLKDAAGKMVSLASLRDKVVVLDFWATWCIPCRASFPEMQVLLDKYKADTTIVFLFIDTWERKTPDKIKAEVNSILSENNFSFKVLFDVSNKVRKDYRVEAIPAKFVIDKKGNIVFMGNLINDLSTAIDIYKE